jgi:hypothetical protein
MVIKWRRVQGVEHGMEYVEQKNGSGFGSEIEKRLMMGRSKVWVRDGARNGVGR